MQKKILIGGQALMHYGSTRTSEDLDYLINEPTNKETFIHVIGQDLINAAGHKFFMEIWEIEQGREMATPQSLLELKAFAFVQHCLNHNWQKADDAEYDIKFLCRKFKLRGTTIVNKYVTYGQQDEINKIIKSTK